MTEAYKSKPESEDDLMDKAFVGFIDEHNYTADEIREAYYRLCGVIDEGGEEANERIKNIEQRMEEMTVAHYPLNRFVRFVTAIESYEDSVQEFENFVSTLVITDKEKILLKSIVNDNRAGELECHVDDKAIAQIKILETKSKEALASALTEKLKLILREVTQGKVSFWFEEK